MEDNRECMVRPKWCTDCQQIKHATEFSARTKLVRGVKKTHLMAVCKPCMVIRSVSWQKKNKEKYDDYQREYHKKHYVKAIPIAK